MSAGVYSINSDGGSSGAGSTHLSYKLELPKETGPVQEQLGLAPAATMVLSMKVNCSSSLPCCLPLLERASHACWQPD